MPYEIEGISLRLIAHCQLQAAGVKNRDFDPILESREDRPLYPSQTVAEVADL